MSIIRVKDLAVDIGDNLFLEPYLYRQFNIDTEKDKTDTAQAEEQSPLRAAVAVTAAAKYAEAERRALREYLGECDVPIAVICCEHIVGTGMQGLPRRIAAGIYKGTYVHIAGNQAHISVVHATDVALAVALVAGTEGEYTLTDGTDPLISDLADALACRIDDKRIFTIKPRWARWWYGLEYFRMLTTDHTAKCTFTDAFPDFHPVEVTQYLRIHVYDEESL